MAADRLPTSVIEVESVVCEVVGSLSYNRGSTLEMNKHVGFMDLGIDSLDAVKLVQALNDRLGLSLSNTGPCWVRACSLPYRSE